ncbi:unnamed protein product [Adineta steineri]|uniref:Uncharacterized protein n=1 Tax=Adineta steineri TaxID=433720 RepID=A0A813XRW8_9BILA|nr:unnamed protein product [Adineta steineri]CAF3856964.1 unnamed protein product [Adineta steineri]
MVLVQKQIQQSTSDEHIVDHNVSPQTTDHVLQYLKTKLSLSDNTTIPNVVGIENSSDDNPINYHVIPNVFMANYYANQNTKITIIQPKHRT